jgi:hypothetical protein
MIDEIYLLARCLCERSNHKERKHAQSSAMKLASSLAQLNSQQVDYRFVAPIDESD